MSDPARGAVDAVRTPYVSVRAVGEADGSMKLLNSATGADVNRHRLPGTSFISVVERDRYYSLLVLQLL